MNKAEGRSRTNTPGAAIAGPAARLPYVIELWNLNRTAPERILARADGLELARAIFAAAEAEHLGRRLVLRRGRQVVKESG
jgi:hypothetical protein